MSGPGDFSSNLGLPPGEVPSGPTTPVPKTGKVLGKHVEQQPGESPETKLFEERKPEPSQYAGEKLTEKHVTKMASDEKGALSKAGSLKAALESLAEELKADNAHLASEITALASDLKAEMDLEKTVSALMNLLKQNELPKKFQPMLKALEPLPTGQKADALVNIASLIRGIEDAEGREALLKALEFLPQGDIVDILKHAVPFCRETSDWGDRLDIIHAFGRIPEEERVMVKEHAGPISKGITDAPLGSIIEILIDIDEKRRANLVEHLAPICKDIPDGWTRVDILKASSLIPEKELVGALPDIVAKFRSITDPKQRGSMILALRLMPEDHRTGALPTIASFVREISDHYQRTFVLDVLKLMPQEQRPAALPNIVSTFGNIPGFKQEVIHEALHLIPEQYRPGAIGNIVTFFQDISERNQTAIIMALEKVPEQQRADVIGHAAQALNLIPQAQRTGAHVNVVTLFQAISDPDERAAILTALRGIPEQERMDVIGHVAPICKNVPYGWSIADILSTLAQIPQEERHDFLMRIVISSQHVATLVQDIDDPDQRAVILQALHEIPEQEREDVLRYVDLICRNVPDAQSRADILSTLALIPQEERANILTNLVSISRPITAAVSQDAYMIDIAREELRTVPLQVLDNLCSQFTKERPNELLVNFLGEKGSDWGGLGKDFIKELFEAIKEKMKFFEAPNGLYRPVLTTEGGSLKPLSDEQKKGYYQVGQLMAFCFNPTEEREYPIGMLFDEGVFTALTRLKPEHLERGFDKIIADDKMFDEMYAIYEAMNSSNKAEVKQIKQMKECLKPLTSETPEKVLQDLFAAVAYEDEVEGLNITSDNTEKIREYYPKLQDALRKTITNTYIPWALAPLFEIANGMKNAPVQMNTTWQDLQKMPPGKISERLQGTVSREMIIEKLQFGEGISSEQQEWIKNWIRNADDAKVKKFLYAMTGTSALGRKGLEIGISEDVPVFHTCFNKAELPLRESEGKVVDMLERAIVIDEGYSIA